jgi:hypothetical protein
MSSSTGRRGFFVVVLVMVGDDMPTSERISRDKRVSAFEVVCRRRRNEKLVCPFASNGPIASERAYFGSVLVVRVTHVQLRGCGHN